MKKYITIAALLAAGTTFANATTITLDSGKGGSDASLYQDIIDGTTQWNGNNSSAYTPAAGSSITFYIDIDKLFGAGSLTDTNTYTLDSFSYIGNDNGWYTGGNRTLTVSNGAETVVFTQGSQGDKFHTTDFTTQNPELLTFKKSDTLTITLASTTTDERVSVNYYDTKSPGVSFTLKDGEVNDGIDHTINPGNTNWKYNSPAIRLTASLVPEPSAFGLLAGVGALALVASRRRRR